MTLKTMTSKVEIANFVIEKIIIIGFINEIWLTYDTY